MLTDLQTDDHFIGFACRVYLFYFFPLITFIVVKQLVLCYSLVYRSCGGVSFHRLLYVSMIFEFYAKIYSFVCIVMIFRYL